MDTRRLTGQFAIPALVALQLVIVFALAHWHVPDGIATNQPVDPERKDPPMATPPQPQVTDPGGAPEPLSAPAGPGGSPTPSPQPDRGALR